MSTNKQQTKSKAARAKYGRRNTGWLKRVRRALAQQSAARTFTCELDAHIAESMKDPEYAAAYRTAQTRHERLHERPCSEGNCVELYDPETGESESGWGPVGCPCQDEADTHLPPAPADVLGGRMSTDSSAEYAHNQTSAESGAEAASATSASAKWVLDHQQPPSAPADTARVDQTILAGDPKRQGNCVSACVATYLDLPLAVVPHFVEYDGATVDGTPGGSGWWWLMVGYMAARGLWPFELDDVREGELGELLFVAGPSVRGVLHQVLYRDGVLWHDPHPSRAGLLKVTEVIAWRPHLHDHQPSTSPAAEGER